MMFASPYDLRRSRHAPPRYTPSPPPPPRSREEPKLALSTTRTGGYVARLVVPPPLTVGSLSANIDGSKLKVTGVAERDESVEYFVHRPSAVYDEHGGVLGHLRAGAVISAHAGEAGWVALEEEGGWVSDRFLEPLRECAMRPYRFSTAARLPHDADVDGATESSARGEYLIHIPAVPRGRAAPPRAVPKAAAPARPKQTPPSKAAPVTAAATTTTAPPPPPDPEKKAMFGGALPRSAAGPVLTECAGSALNVQRPEERSEEWAARQDGGFEMLE